MTFLIYAGMGSVFFRGFGLVVQLLIFITFLGIIYWVIKSGKFTNESAKDILKKRLAKGEITKKEYKELLEEIEEGDKK